MVTTPSDCICMNSGCSSRHSTHQDANRLTSDTSPRRSAVDRPSERPFTGGRLNCGTDFPINVEGNILGSRVRPHANAIAITTKTAIGAKSTNRLDCRLSAVDAVGLTANSELMIASQIRNRRDGFVNALCANVVWPFRGRAVKYDEHSGAESLPTARCVRSSNVERRKRLDHCRGHVSFMRIVWEDGGQG